ncbi:lactoylglutathione lyase [Actinomadura sp. LD22]|uniref:Lactoylglutathione lyase n=1 Tax=Actinomadura physcomitrii TaxID=2650748 RepID=A0A6I4MBA8_9ACTN|nr:VOC family protein [Actinomadura physcomitrii]MWA02953.1 lactoylglutathione lyase [Actinomadura physcomitrii]
MTALRIAHANIRTRDLKASVAFYRELGLEISGCLRLGEDATLVYLAAPGAPDLTIELAAHHHAPADFDRSPGSGHLALAVGDLDALVARLAKAGVQPESPPYHPGDRPDLRVCFVQDPSGVRVELIEGSFPTPKDELPAGLSGA